MFSVRIQQHDFDASEEYEALRVHAGVGAIASFVGLVREFDDGSEQSSLFLEHYPGMTERVIEDYIEQARQRWPVEAARIVHRVGTLDLGEQIVFVGVASAHRGAAFAACEYLMDLLKVSAPIWKKENNHWVAAKASDDESAKRWTAPDDAKSDEQ